MTVQEKILNDAFQNIGMNWVRCFTSTTEYGRLQYAKIMKKQLEGLVKHLEAGGLDGKRSTET